MVSVNNVYLKTHMLYNWQMNIGWLNDDTEYSHPVKLFDKYVYSEHCLSLIIDELQ